MRFRGPHIGFIPMLAILDSLRYFNKSRKIQLKDLRGTCIYEKCEKALLAGEPVPSLVIQVSKSDNDVPSSEPWGAT